MRSASSTHGARWDDMLAALRDEAFDEATRICEEGVAEDPSAALWHLGLSWVHMGQNDLPEAVRAIRKALRRDRQNAAVYRTLSTLMLQKGDIDLALEAAQIAMRLEPDATSKALVHRAQKMRRGAKSREWVPGASETKTSISYIGRQRPTSLSDRLSAPNAGSLSLPGGGELDTEWTPQSTTTVVATTLFEGTEQVVIPLSTERVDGRGSRRRRTTGSLDLSHRGNLTGGLENQLHVMYGASLFGPWNMTVRPTPVAGVVDSTGRSVRRALFALLAIALIGTATVAGITLMQKRRAAARAEHLRHVQELLTIGALEPLTGEVEVLEREVGELGEDSPAARALALTQALLYRYRDAAPQRRKRALELVAEQDPAGRYAVTTRALLSTDIDRATLLPQLELLADRTQIDPLPAFLIGCTYEAAGALVAARKSYARALRLQPANLMVLSRLALLEEARDNLSAGLDRATEMLDISPSDPMTHFTEAALRARSQTATTEEIASARSRADSLPAALGGTLWVELLNVVPNAGLGVTRRWRGEPVLHLEAAQRLLLSGRDDHARAMAQTSSSPNQNWVRATWLTAADITQRLGDRRRARALRHRANGDSGEPADTAPRKKGKGRRR